MISCERDKMSERYISVTENDFLAMASVKEEKPQEKATMSISQVKPQMRNRKTLDSFYRNYFDVLCGFLRRRYGNGPPDPEDVAQATFERISELDGLAEIRNPRGFLFTIAGRIFIDKTRKRAVSDKYIAQLLNLNGVQVEEITPERVYSAREDFKAILNTLKNIGPKHREVVLRHRILGQTYDEISCATDLSPASISRYLKMAMATVFNKAHQNEDGKGE